MRSIRVYLLILVLGAMLPGALVTGVLVWRAFAGNRAVTERRLLDSARVDASAVDREFASVISTLDVLATSPALDRDDRKAFYDEARRVHSTQQGWHSIVLSSTDSRPLLSTRLALGDPMPPVVDAASLDRLFETRRPVVGVIRPEPDGGPEHLFAIRVPVLRDGTVKYALSAVLNVDSLARIVPSQLPEEWTRAVLDSEGTVAVRTRGARDYVGVKASEPFRARIRQNREAVSSETTREGIPVYAAVSRGAYQWAATVVVPRAALDTPLRASMTGVLAGGALLMLCGLAAVLFVSRRLSSDLAAATTSAEAVAEERPLPHAEAHVAETDRLQRALARAVSLLENRAHERDEQIRRADLARTEAEEANKTKDRFLAVLGHELRNPLAPALTALELMKAADPQVFSREREVLERQIAHMSRLVNDLLDLSRLGRGEVALDRRRFELKEAVDRAVDMARPLVDRHRHVLNVSVPASGLALDADIDRIVQVLSNLLTNAAKYTEPGGHLTISASASGGRVMIACDDDGPGVAPDVVRNLFDPFTQGPRALDRRDGGLGLGLALARTFTELHGGTINLEPRERGSRFVVTLPLARRLAVTPEVESVKAATVSSTRRILLVDDNRDASEMLQSALEHAGHQLALAGNGADAIQKAAVFLPDIGVLDIGLPGMNGYELAGELRRAHPGIRLIALTGYSGRGDIDAAEAAGFEAHCAKPITTAALLDLIERPESGLPSFS